MRQKPLRLQEQLKAKLGPAPTQPRGQDSWQVPHGAAMPSPEPISKSGSAASHCSQHPGRSAHRQTLSGKPRDGSALLPPATYNSRHLCLLHDP